MTSIKTKMLSFGSAGIAIGPIMFVIAILGILAAAIAAGSGSFTAGSAAESNRVKASAVIEIGQNLKIGFDRITGSGGIEHNAVYIHPNNTSANTDLFSPTGGGINPPSVAMANASGTDVWYYPTGNFNGLGTGNYSSRMAVLRVSSGVCDEINNKVNGTTTPLTPAVNDVGNFATNGDTDIPDANIKTLWPAALRSKSIGCVHNNNTGSSGYYFYQVLGVR